MQADDPPYLSVGTAVSAKYKGAFCEAKVSKVVRIVKCKVTYKMGLGNATLSDEQIKGTLRVGQIVQAKHPDKKELVDATITKIQDCSQYTVVFDDGDITTLRRTALCLKSGRHFNESETLDQLPLTHPEHFGNPVMGGSRRGRRSRQPKEDSSDGEVEEENEPNLEGYLLDIGRIVSVESTEKKRSKDNWFPGLVVIPSAQPTVRINAKDEYLIRSFKDGRYYTVPKKEVSEFSRSLAEKVESSHLAEAIQKALKFLDHNELPVHWEKGTLFHSTSLESETDDNFTDSSDDEPCEEKDRFVAQLYKFLDDAGTPLNKTPAIAGRDIDLHRLFQVVQKLGGGNRVTNQNKWKRVTARLRGLPNNQIVFNQVKSVYKKCLASYETFYRTLGVTMLNHTRSNKKNRGRSLIRDKDRSTPINSPQPERVEDEIVIEEKKEVVPVAETSKGKKKDEKKRLPPPVIAEVSDTNSSDTTDHSEASTAASKESVILRQDTGRPKRERESKYGKETKIKVVPGEKVKALVEKFEEQVRKDEEEKIQHTRSKSLSKPKEPPPKEEKKTEPKPTPKDTKIPQPKLVKKPPEDEKKKGKKRVADKASSGESSSESSVPAINIGDKLKVYYGPTHESKVTYEAKVIEIDKDQSGPVYLVHYTGWNTRYDEWIQPQRVAENLSATTKAKRLKQSAAAIASSSNKPQPAKVAAKRRTTTTSRSTAPSEGVPRSTTPSSVTSSSSRTKSPATPATTRSTSRLTRQDSMKRTRRISAQTDVSNHTEEESESDGSGSESELSRTRSGLRVEEPELKTYRRKNIKPPTLVKMDKRKEKEDDDTEKEDESEKPTLRRTRKTKRSSEKSTEESEDEINPPKGRDFDLNQIRSELKGFSKVVKVNVDTMDKEVVSSSDDSTNPPILEKSADLEEEPVTEEEVTEKKEKQEEKPLTSCLDVYEFKEPEPFEFESRTKLGDEKIAKKRLTPRIFDDLETSPPPKKIIKAVPGGSSSPSKTEKPSASPDRRSIRRTPLRRHESQDDTDDDELDEEDHCTPPKEKDPFDKLVESPSFNFVKTMSSDRVPEINPIPLKLEPDISEDSLSLFRELPETVDEYSRDMELSDCESQTQIFTREGELFADTFSKPSPDGNILDMEFSSGGKTDEGKHKDSDEDESIREQIQRVIAQSAFTDEDSNDALLIMPPTTSYLAKKRDIDTIQFSSILGISSEPPVVEVLPAPVEVKPEEPEEKPPSPAEVKKEEPPAVVEKSIFAIEKQIISPALQETDSSLLESIVSQPTISIDLKLEETAKELSNVKTGTKIADSILQKFNSIKNELEAKVAKTETLETKEEKDEKKPEFKFELPIEEFKEDQEKAKVDQETYLLKNENSSEAKDADLSKTFEEISKKPLVLPRFDPTELKKRKRVLSRAFIEESDSDSSDSEQLVIARSDDDSQTNSIDNKLATDAKASDSSNLFTQLQTTDESQSQEERNFNFDKEEKSKPESPQPAKQDQSEIQCETEPNPTNKSDTKAELSLPEPDEDEEDDDDEEDDEEEEEEEPAKEEEPDDPHLHSLLLCEEEIPRSPAPSTEPSNQQEEGEQQAVQAHEMPFASAPGPSRDNGKPIVLLEPQKKVSPPRDPPLEAAVVIARGARVEASTVLDNTPPTTPESSISNLSPRGEIGGLSPNAGDNESCKSNDVEQDYPRQRRNSSIKVSPYSEEDTQMTLDPVPLKKHKDDLQHHTIPSPCKKRRKSLRSSDDNVSAAKRGRKSSQHQQRNGSTSMRRDSDSDDTSEDRSNAGSTKMSRQTQYERRANRSPRPSKYNFFVEFDPSLDSGQRIAVLQQKLSELRKTYADVKAELAAVERRRKKIRRREREALKAAKQEMACA